MSTIPKIPTRLLATAFLLSSSLVASAEELQPGVRGVATRAPENMKIDGNLEEFADAFCTPVEYFHADQKNRPAQFFYMWDDEAFYAGLRTLEEEDKQANPSPDDKLWGGDGVEWYFDTRRGEKFRDRNWGPGAVHCYWTAFTNKELGPRFCVRPDMLDAIPKIGIEVAARRTEHGVETEFKLPWANFPEFKAALGEVIALDAELCYSDGGIRVFRTFAFGSPLSVTQPASQGKIQLVERLEPDHWKSCGPVMMPLRVDVPWNQHARGDRAATSAHAFAQIAVPPNQTDEFGVVYFEVRDLEGKLLGKYLASEETMQEEGNFARLTANWPTDVAVPGAHHVTAVVYNREGKVLTRVAPRLQSVNINVGY